MTETSESLDDKTLDNLILTTSDNPFNPRTDYYKWRNWDEDAGYYTEAYLARVADIPLDVDLDDEVLIGQFTQRAIQTIIDNDPLNVYVLV